MSAGEDFPIYFIRVRDQWLDRGAPRPGMVSGWGDRDEAEAFAREEAWNKGLPAAAFKIVEYVSSGQIHEVDP